MIRKLRSREWNWLTQGHSGYYQLTQDLLCNSQKFYLLYHETVCLWVSSLEILGWDHSASWSQLWHMGLHPTLFFSARPFIPHFLCCSHLLTHPEIWKRKRNLSDPWKILLQTKPAPTPSCFFPSAVLKSMFFGLSSVGFAQLWRCPDSQQSWWVTMPHSEFEICYCSLKSFFKEFAISACLILNSINFWLRFIYCFFFILEFELANRPVGFIHHQLDVSWFWVLSRAWPQVKLWNSWYMLLASNCLPLQSPSYLMPFPSLGLPGASCFSGKYLTTIAIFFSD